MNVASERRRALGSVCSPKHPAQTMTCFCLGRFRHTGRYISLGTWVRQRLVLLQRVVSAGKDLASQGEFTEAGAYFKPESFFVQCKHRLVPTLRLLLQLATCWHGNILNHRSYSKIKIYRKEIQNKPEI